MKKIPYLIPLIVAITLLWQVAPGHAQQRPEYHRGWDFPGPRHGTFGETVGVTVNPLVFGGRRHLDLSEEQRKQIKSVRREAARKHIQQQADVRLAHLDLQALMEAEEPDRKEIHAQLKKIAKLQGDMRITQVDQRLDIRELLTPDQRQKAKKMRPRADSRVAPTPTGLAKGGRGKNGVAEALIAKAESTTSE